jgi:hypothetical protein
MTERAMRRYFRNGEKLGEDCEQKFAEENHAFRLIAEVVREEKI